MLPRDMAGKFEVKGGTGEITRMEVVDGYLEVYKIDKTFRVQTPEGLDPERTNPTMPLVISEHSDHGSSNPFIARLLLQSIDILNSSIFEKEIDKDKIISLLHDSKELILECESLMLELGKKMDEIEKPLRAEGVQMDDNFRSINPFPQVAGLKDLSARFLVSAKRCIQNYSIMIDHFYNTGIRSPNYKKIKKWASDNLGEESYLYILINDGEEKLFHIVHLRNFQEHPNDDKKTVVENYKLLPEMAINQPVWYVTGEERKYIYEDMRFITLFMFEFGENLLIHCVLENLSKKYPFVIYQEEADKIDEKCPITFRLSIDHSKLKKI